VSNTDTDAEVSLGRKKEDEAMKTKDVSLKGFRNLGTKKQKLIDQADRLLVRCHQSGIKTNTLLKVLGIHDLDFDKITTKQWTGIIGTLKKFMIDNNIRPDYEALPYKRSCWNAHERTKTKWRRSLRAS
jgi:hypothetical protein